LRRVTSVASTQPATTAADFIPAPTPGHSTRHRLNGLDGFRAIAVTVVVLFHFGVPGFSGGWVGPELFFVLSGYLITTLLLDRSEPDGPGLSLLDFWKRRIKRLYPALLFLVAALFSVVALLDALRVSTVSTVTPSALVSESTAAIAYYANWHLIAQHIGYFAPSPSLFKHTWSLAIEEQFYVVWPLIFVVIRRSRAGWRSTGVAVAGAAAMASALYTALTVGRGSLNTAYYATQNNAFHLLIGVTLAFASHGWTPSVAASRRLTRLAGPALLAIVGIMAMSSTGSGQPRLWMLRGGEVALDLAAAVLLTSLVFGSSGSSLSRLLNLRMVVWIGSLSYGIYLWHYPLGVLVTPAATGLPHAVVVLILIAGTLAAAAFSYHFVEVVVRETLIPETRRRWVLYGLALAGTAALLVAAPSLIRPT
jgi:peptidoglycan/LPS O-acetylase OafA/YrhL